MTWWGPDKKLEDDELSSTAASCWFGGWWWASKFSDELQQVGVLVVGKEELMVEKATSSFQDVLQEE